MPSVSKAQNRLMCGICHHSIPSRGSLSTHKACEFCGSSKGLPQRSKRKRKKHGS